MELRFACLVEGTDNAYLHMNETFKSSSGYLIQLFTDLEWLKSLRNICSFQRIGKNVFSANLSVIDIVIVKVLKTQKQLGVNSQKSIQTSTV